MKGRPVLATGLGLALLVWLLARAGLPAVWTSVRMLGFGGFAAILAFQLGLAGLAGCAWALLGRGRPDAGLGRFVWARLVRDAASQVLPFAQVGGIALGGRALALEGVDGVFATASTITDMAIEFTSQVAYAALGAVLLQALRPHNPLGRPVLGVIAGLAIMAAGLLWAQAPGWGVVQRLVRRFSRKGPGGPAGLSVAETFADMRRRPGALALAGIAHLSAWMLTGVLTWLTLYLLHAPVSLGGALVVDSLTSGAKALAFLVPGALGVQEGALVLLGALFGVSPAAALALSLTRRARDLVLAAPVLALWQARQGGRIWGLRATSEARRS